MAQRNGRRSESGRDYSSSSAWLSGLMSLAGGVGLGAGLLYLLDPDKGEKRRRRMMSGAANLASSAREYAGEALGGVGSKVGEMFGTAREYAGESMSGLGSYAGKKMRGVSDYASEKVDDARQYAVEKLAGETRAEHRINMSICALSSMALGAAVMYMFDPASGRNRRRYVSEQASNYASQAGEYARDAGTAIRDKVSSMTSGGSTTEQQQPQGQPQQWST
jgi:hypothetical protein